MTMPKFAIPLLVLVLVCVGVAVAWQHARKTNGSLGMASNVTAQIRYLPLGDSYTIGESVGEADRWPNQLVARLQQDKLSIAILANPSVTGYTTQNLIDKELPLLPKLKPNFVTLLIGVNDYVQGVSAQTFEAHLQFIINAIQAQLPNPKQLVLVTIPDYGKTPTGAEYGNPAQSKAGIIAFNAIIKKAALDRGLALADVFPSSQQVAQDASLIAPDGLHPSGKQYALWTNAIYDATKPLLEP